MEPRRFVAVCATVVALFAAGCSSDDDSPPAGTSSPAASEESLAPTSAPGTTITTGDSQHGPILIDGDGRAIYVWEAETTSTPQCYFDCAETWPPVLTDGEPGASGDAAPELLGTTVRDEGTTQVTYNGRPLYTCASEGPDDASCHNVTAFDGLWSVVQPDGEPVA